MPRPRTLGRTTTLLIPVALLACGPQNLDEEPALLDERCGSTEPTRLLSLAPEEIVSFGPNAVARHLDGWLVAVSTLEAPFDGTLQGQASAHRVVSVDECGEREPQLVLEGVDRIFAPASGGLPWLGCSSTTEEMFSFDPEVPASSTSLGVVEHCRFRESGDAVWLPTRRDGERLDLVRMALGSEQFPFPMHWTVTDDLFDGPASVAVDAVGDYAWMVNGARELVEIRLDPREFTLVAEDAEMVFLALGDRFVVWGSEADPFTPGQWTILDRESGERVVADVGGQTELLAHASSFSLVFESERDEVSSDYSIVRLPSLETSTLTGRWARFVDNGPGDMVLLELGVEPDLYVLRAGASEPELLYEGNVVDFRVDDGEVWAWDYYDYEPGSPLRESQTRLVRIPLGGGEAEVVVDGVWQPQRMDDGRWLAVEGYGGDGLGELRVIDPEEGTSALVDREVSMWSSRLDSWAHSFPGETSLSPDDAFLYSVHDAERSGLWAATVAARE